MARAPSPEAGHHPFATPSSPRSPPTGTISPIAGTTAGIEQIFAIAYVRSVLDRQLVEINPLFDRTVRDLGFHSDHLMPDIARTGTVRDNPAVPEEVRVAFPTALDMAPQWHCACRPPSSATWTRPVSKTVNLPAESTVEDVRAIFLSAWRARVKRITVYRYDSKPGQVLPLLPARDSALGPPVHVATGFAGGCAAHACDF